MRAPSGLLVPLLLAAALLFTVLTTAKAQPAQPAGKVYRIGLLETTSAAYLSADGKPERFPELATALIHRKVDLIVTRGTPAVLAAKTAAPTTPIVMATSGDPVGAGVVSSLARPGGNVTGLSTMTAQLGGKRLALLKEALPGSERIAVITNLSNPAFVSAGKRDIDIAAQSLGLLGLPISLWSSRRSTSS